MGSYTKATPSRAVTEACRLWRKRRLEQHLRRRDIHWREIRRRVLGWELFGTRWSVRAGGRAMRLTRRGLEFRENGEVRRYSWKQMQEISHNSRN